MDFFIIRFHFNDVNKIQKDNFPAQRQIVVYGKNDGDIPKNISLPSKITNNKKDIEIYESKKSDHLDDR